MLKCASGLSSCMPDTALGFCFFANSLCWLSVPHQQTNKQTHTIVMLIITRLDMVGQSCNVYWTLRDGTLRVLDNLRLLTLFVGFWILALMLQDCISADKSSQIPVPRCAWKSADNRSRSRACRLLVKATAGTTGNQPSRLNNQQTTSTFLNANATGAFFWMPRNRLNGAWKVHSTSVCLAKGDI